MLAELLAVSSAAAAGAAVVAQQRAAHELGGAADRRLLRRPWWLAGTAASVVASALQAVALAGGAVVVVQALLATAVAWTTVGESLLARRPPGRAALAGAGLAMLGPLLVVVLLGPVTTGGTVELASTPVLLGLVGVGAVAVAGLVWARRPGPAGALGLALAYGAGYGLAASLLAVLARDPGAVLADPQHALAAALLLVVGPAAFVASQRALARARRAGPVVTVVLLADPLVATVLGAAWFGERLALDPPVTTGIVLAAGLAVVGVRLLDPAPADAAART
ncbi:hypothetical protein ACFPK1_14825 [Actinomycetospora rhizophila]|uniref:Integral membrane protein n=1 Tax=Actinomycetospora rhizophila TaxID=1416876 RepID=A0ABV9ZEP8_9PSEU